VADSYVNPVLPGMNSDPSVCRVGDDYYLSSSSFVYVPGVPIYHSRDLLNWTLIGHAITRVEQADLSGMSCNSGLWATTLRHHAGRFYLVTAHMRQRRLFYVTAEDPSGPWSDPVFLETDGFCYDPSLDIIDGVAYLGYTCGTGSNEMRLGEIDLASGRWLRRPQAVWRGSGGFGAEGQHLYRIGDWWYLIDAEGGNVNQAMTCVRSRDPYGPYESCPRNPVVSNKENRGHLLQCIGHGDLVQHANGSWWFLCHAVRNYGAFDDLHSVLGREVVLLPVDWIDGWPSILDGGPVTQVIRRAIPGQQAEQPRPFHDDFTGPDMRAPWNTLRRPAGDLCRLDPAGGGLLLHGAAPALDSAETPAFLGLRQDLAWGRVRTTWSFTASGPHEEAGLCFFMNERHHFTGCITNRNGAACLVIRRCADDLRFEQAVIPLAGPRVTLEVDCNPWAYEWFLVPQTGDRVLIAKTQNRLLTLHVAGGFTGVMIGLYATGNGQANREPARVSGFSYQAIPDLVGPTRP
jgi:alpha-N-arabinofuranosidase